MFEYSPYYIDYLTYHHPFWGNKLPVPEVSLKLLPYR